MCLYALRYIILFFSTFPRPTTEKYEYAIIEAPARDETYLEDIPTVHHANTPTSTKIHCVQQGAVIQDPEDVLLYAASC